MVTNTSASLLFLSLLIFLFFSSSSAAATATAATLPRKPNSTPAIIFPPKGPPANPFCPRDVVKLASCIELLGVVDAVGGGRLSRKCCSLINGLAAGEAAACLCTAIKENALGIGVEWDVGLSIVVSSCKKEVPDGFKCV
ncbi:hypothetical protein IEQ34_005525 [Dendrobium chrysotoxum]|uniref:Bifunctional inhibitor/plant lipid transfer protein/seed storage helical domain-containing protein n=1 Tax=Dendrobium chrysotoxum TaxID=161865 RepID=A0AAV7HC33_DENCH|nr:hypothetical protein IEQ34_005525 [Dendrobium chrysotoxum]